MVQWDSLHGDWSKTNSFTFKWDIKGEPYGWQVCGEGLLELWPQPYHPRLQVEGDAAGVTMRGVRRHAPVNHTVFFLCHGFIKFMNINKILMKTRLIVVYYILQCELLCVPTSGSGFYQWVSILSVGLDFASGSGFASGYWYENPVGQTPCCIMWSTHNHCINWVYQSWYWQQCHINFANCVCVYQFLCLNMHWT